MRSAFGGIAALEAEIELVARFRSLRAGMEEEAAADSPPHVLVVDDCPIDRKIVEKLLLKSGMFKVTAVGSGKKAMEVLGLNEEKDESHSTIESNCLSSIPVVIMSSENKPQRITRCLDMGAEDFMLKPLHVNNLQKLRSYIGSVSPASKTGTKRKVPHDIVQESNGSERRPRLAGVAVA